MARHPGSPKALSSAINCWGLEAGSDLTPSREPVQRECRRYPAHYGSSQHEKSSCGFANVAVAFSGSP
jgi:hypothetical protein